MKDRKWLAERLAGTPRRKLLACLAVVGMAILFSAIIPNLKKTEAESGRIKRKSYGEGTKKETLQVQPEGGKAQQIEIEVHPREYTRNELQALFRQAVKKLDETLRGNNESYDHVEEELSLPTKLNGYPFTITWEFSRYDVIDMGGKLKQESLEDEDKAREGILVTITAVLRYQEEEALYTQEVRVFAKTAPMGVKEKILNLVKQADQETAEDAYLTLPDEVEGKRLYWSTAESSPIPVICVLSLVGGLCMLLIDRQKKEQAEKRRREQMLCDYPELISQFTMLMGAGMTVRNTWKKVTADYQEQKAYTGRERAVYEEMLYTWQEMQSGISETEGYERFARRCGLPQYMKFGALLSQNLKKGAKGMAHILNVEALQAMEERKSRAKRLGEEAGAKLLAPMFLMLAVVMAIIIIPAFWSIQV